MSDDRRRLLELRENTMYAVLVFEYREHVGTREFETLEEARAFALEPPEPIEGLPDNFPKTTSERMIVQSIIETHYVKY